MRQHILLVEKLVLEQRLLEDRLSFLRDNYLKRLDASNIINNMPSNIQAEVEAVDTGSRNASLTDKLFAYIVGHDPDPTKRHAQWLLNLLLKGNMQIEDLQSASDLISQFMQAKRSLPPDQRDINRFKTLGDLSLVVGSGDEVVSKRELDRRLEKDMYAQATVLYNSPAYRILVPRTQQASCYFGVNTRWCTAATSGTNYFDTYNKKGPLYIVLHKPSNTRWQFHFETRQFMDELDRQINIDQFIQQHPEVAKFFEDLDGGEKHVIGEFRGREVVRRGNTIAVIRGKGLKRGPDYASFTIEDGTMTRVTLPPNHSGWPDTNYELFEDKELVDLLNSFDVSYGRDVIERLAYAGIFFDYRTKKWGFIDKIGKRKKSGTDGFVWFTYKVDDTVFIELNNTASGMAEMRAKVEDGVLDVMPQEPSATKDPVYQRLFVELVLSTPNLKRIEKDGDGVFTLNDVDPSLLPEVLTKKPELASAPTLLTAYGPEDKRVHDAIRRHYEEAGIKLGETVFGTSIIHSTYDSPADLGATSPGKEFNYFDAIVSGDEYLESYYDGMVDASDRESFLQSLKPEVLKKVGEYMAAEHKDWIEERQEDDEDYTFDVSSVDDILEMHEDVEDDSLEQAFRSAKSSGLESGASREAYEIFKDAFESSDYVYFLKDGEWVREFTFDTKCAIIVPVVELAKAIDHDEDLYDVDNWLDYVGETINPQEPYYGFSGYDEDYANERFSDEIHEFLK